MGRAVSQDPLGIALRHRPFRFFLFGAFLTNAGGWFQSLSVPVVLYGITGSALWVGLATVAQFLPVMIFGPWAGAIAERCNRRVVVMIAQLFRSLIALGIWAVWWAGWHDPWLILALAVATGIAQGLSMASWQALIQNYVPRDALSSAVSLNTIQFNLARSLGPAAAGLVLYLAGPATAFFVTFVMVLAVVLVLKFVEPVTEQRVKARKDRAADGGFGEALRYAAHNSGVRTALVMVFVVGAIGMPIFQHVITFAEDVFDSGPLGVALLNLGLGLGTVVGIPLLSWGRAWLKRSTLAALAIAGYAVTLAFFALAPNLIVASIATIAVGVFFLLGLSIGQSAVQVFVADAVRGRVLSISVMVYTGSVALGAVLQGQLADLVGLRPTVLLSAAAMAACGLFLAFQSSRLRLKNLDSQPDTDYIYGPPQLESIGRGSSKSGDRVS